jgi:hypothetical protein
MRSTPALLLPLVLSACGSAPPRAHTAPHETSPSASEHRGDSLRVAQTARVTRCPKEQIVITAVSYGRWEADCGGNLYHCTAGNSGPASGARCELSGFADAPKEAPPVLVTHTTDPASGARGVTATFALEQRASLHVTGTPAVDRSTLELELSTPRPYAKRDGCSELSIVVEGAASAGSGAETVDNVGAATIRAAFDFQLFKPLAAKQPTFAVRRCATEFALDEAQTQSLRQLLASYSELAMAAQPNHP